MEETNRQRKIAGVLQKDLVDVLQKAGNVTALDPCGVRHLESRCYLGNIWCAALKSLGFPNGP